MSSTRSALHALDANKAEAGASLAAKNPSRRQTLAAPLAAPAAGGSRRKSLAANRRQSQGRKSLGRMSLSGSRQSIGGRGRRSSVMPMRGKGGVLSKADPRPLNDKQYMASSSKTLIRFLSEHGYARNVSLKTLQSPTSKDFYCMVEFLYRLIDPNYEMDRKFEEAIPAIFKSLGYPFPISKTALYAVGSPHTWPSLLGALSWLVELITYQEQLEEAETEAADALQEENAEKLFFNYLSAAYGTFMAGDDDSIQKLDEQLEQQFETRNAKIAEANRALEHSAQSLEHELQRTLAAPMRLANVEAQRATLASDVDKFRQLIDELNAHLAAIAQRDATHAAELEAKEAEIDATRDEIVALQARLDKQELRPADVDRLQTERATLQRTLNALINEREQCVASVTEKQQSISERLQRIDELLAEYHSEARRLQLIPSNAANARGRNFTIQFSTESPDDEQQLSACVKRDVLPALGETLEEARAAVIEDQRALLELSAQKEALIEQLQDERQALERLQHRAKKCESAYAAEKDKCAAELRAVESEIEQIQSELASAKDAVESGLQTATSTVAERRSELKAMQAQFAEEKATLARTVETALDVVSKHKAFVTEKLEATLQSIEDEIRETEE